MASQEIGSAYLTVKPKADPGFSNELESAGGKAGGGFGMSFAVAAGNLISTAVEKIATAAVEVFTDAFNNYADYEQLVGGVETLFKDSAGVVQQYAANAYMTAGLSANEYMENVTSFSASLLQSLSGNTELAASYADRAMIDMSDNANKMGTDMQRITDAYQGFAKDNYTMLDNLKLGYGGTKTEMQRLIKDASKMTDIQEELGSTVDESSMSFGNVVNAISVMQKSMGIAGTTAEEGSKTISGSINKLSASWQNFLTGIFDDKADMGVLGERLLDSLGDVMANVVPRMLVLVGRLFIELPQALADGFRSIPDAIGPMVTSILGDDLGGKITTTLTASFGSIGNIFQALNDKLKQVFEALRPIIEKLGVIIVNVGAKVAPAFEKMGALVTSVISAIGDIISGVLIPAIDSVLTVLSPVLEFVAEAVSNMFEVTSMVLTGIVDVFNATIVPLASLVADVVNGIASFFTEAFNAIAELFNDVCHELFGDAADTFPSMQEIINSVVSAIQSFFSQVWPVIKQIVSTAFEGIRSVASAVWPVVKDVVMGAVSAIKGAIEGISSVVGSVASTFNSIYSAIAGPIQAAADFVGGVVNEIVGFFSGLGDRITSAIGSIHFPTPHVEWGSLDIAGAASIPLPTVEWYKTGGFVDEATLIGAGEAGPEMILPKSGGLMAEFAQAVSDRVNRAGGPNQEYNIYTNDPLLVASVVASKQRRAYA